MDDYYARRVENIDGTMPAAKFVLRRSEEGPPKELDNVAELPKSVHEFGKAGLELKRFKGLGEMNPDELSDTTMNPESAACSRWSFPREAEDPEQLELDAREADRIFSILMGDDVDSRREFIEANAANVKNLDI